MTGHVFVVHGRIESVVHDHALVTTDDYFSLREHFRPVVGTQPKHVVQPEPWPGPGYGRARDGSPVWFVSVGGNRSIGPEALIERAVRALQDIGEAAAGAAENRVKTLVAMPVLGISGGGLGDRQGEVVALQLREMRRAARELDLDIAMVTPSASVHAAAQHVRLQPGSWPLSAASYERASNLARIARQGDLALFLGAGVSIPAGLPSWRSLVEQLASRRGIDSGHLGNLSVLDQAQLIAQGQPSIGQEVASIVRRYDRPSLAHALLASLGCHETVTTNYDRLYELAVAARGDVTSEPATILPWEVPRAAKPWILKLHGDADNPHSIVLTRDQFVGFDRTTKPAGALLQSLLMTRHLLVVGASLDDDNVVRLLYEVDGFRREYDLTERMGTVLDVDLDEARRQLWKGKLEWIPMEGQSLPERARELEIFLDAVAAHASRDSSWLLDERFSGLLDGPGRDVARRARALHDEAARMGRAWESLVDVLRSHGAPGRD